MKHNPSSHTNPELFELCKEVYKRTGWGNLPNETESFYVGTYKTGYKRRFIRGVPAYTNTYPYYTSDYLLEKLPRRIVTPEPLVPSRGQDRDCVLMLSEDTDKEGWVTGYDSVYGQKGIYWQLANTPLKALLKLVIALHKAGELQ